MSKQTLDICRFRGVLPETKETLGSYVPNWSRLGREIPDLFLVEKDLLRDVKIAQTEEYSLILRPSGEAFKTNGSDIVLIPDFISEVGGTLEHPGDANDIDFVVRLAQSDVTKSLLEGIYLLLRKKFDPEKKGIVHILPAPEGPHGDYKPIYDLVMRPKIPPEELVGPSPLMKLPFGILGKIAEESVLPDEEDKEQKQTSEEIKLDLGCGENKEEGFTGIDKKPGPEVDKVWDLEQGIPYPDNSVDIVRAHHFLEHMPEPIKIMDEIWRVLKPGGELIFEVPSTEGPGAFADPTHKSYWNALTFNWFTDDTLRESADIQAKFEVKKLEQEVNPEFGTVYVKGILRAIKENKGFKVALEPIQHFTPPKPAQKGRAHTDAFSPEEIWPWVEKHLEAGVVAEPKYNGFRAICQKSGSRLSIFFEDSQEERAAKLMAADPQLDKLKNLPDCILDCNVGVEEGGKPWPRPRLMTLTAGRPELSSAEKFNPHHGAGGRFAEGAVVNGGSAEQEAIVNQVFGDFPVEIPKTFVVSFESMPKSEAGEIGAYHEGDTLRVSKSLKGDALRMTLAHEYTHNAMRPFDNPPLGRETVRSLTNLRAGHLKNAGLPDRKVSPTDAGGLGNLQRAYTRMKGSRPVSAYALASPSEYAGEVVSHYLYKPSLLQSRDPGAYALMAGTFGKKEISEFKASAHILITAFDVLYWQNDSTNERPFAERRKVLESVKGILSRAGVEISPQTRIRSKGDLIAAWKSPGFGKATLSEGLVLKALDGVYEPGASAGWMAKIKHSLEIKAIVLEVKSVTGGKYNFRGGLIPGTMEGDLDNLVDFKGKKYVDLGFSFNVGFAASPGDIITAEVEEINWDRPDRRLNWLGANPLDVDKERTEPYVARQVIEMAQRAMVLQETPEGEKVRKRSKGNPVRFGWQTEDIEFEGQKFNPHHGAGGRFASGGGGGGAFGSEDAAHKWASSHESRTIAGSGPDSDLDVDALASYTGTDYLAINGGLRSGNLPPNQKMRVMVMDGMIGRSKPLDQDVTAFRGVNGEVAANLKSGTTFKDNGFVSSSFKMNVAKDFASGKAEVGLNLGSPGAVMEIHIPKGSKGRYVDSIMGDRAEMEFLLPRGARFEVNGRSSAGHTIVEYLGSNPTKLKEQEYEKVKRDTSRFGWSPEDIEFEGEKFNPYHDTTGRFGTAGFGSVGEAHDWGAALQGDTKLSGRERQALADYRGTGYKAINGHLRQGKPPKLNKDNRETVEDLNRLMDRAPRTDRDVIAFRGVEGIEFKPGQRFNDNGFVSTSFDRKVAAGFSTRHGGTILEIRIPKGSRGLYVEAIAQRSQMFKPEYEFLLGHGATFEVDGRGSGGRLIAEYVGSAAKEMSEKETKLPVVNLSEGQEGQAEAQKDTGPIKLDLGCGSNKPEGAVLSKEISEAEKIIVKEDGKWILYSRDRSHVLGRFDTEREAIVRERQIQFFKHERKEADEENIPQPIELRTKVLRTTPVPNGYVYTIALRQNGQDVKIGKTAASSQKLAKAGEVLRVRIEELTIADGKVNIGRPVPICADGEECHTIENATRIVRENGLLGQKFNPYHGAGGRFAGGGGGTRSPEQVAEKLNAFEGTDCPFLGTELDGAAKKLTGELAGEKHGAYWIGDTLSANMRDITGNPTSPRGQTFLAAVQNKFGDAPFTADTPYKQHTRLGVDALYNSTQKRLAGLPESFQLYRGVQTADPHVSSPRLSFWTTNRRQAEVFAGPTGKVLKGNVQRKAIVYTSYTNKNAHEIYSGVARKRDGGKGWNEFGVWGTGISGVKVVGSGTVRPKWINEEVLR